VARAGEADPPQLRTRSAKVVEPKPLRKSVGRKPSVMARSPHKSYKDDSLAGRCVEVGGTDNPKGLIRRPANEGRHNCAPGVP